MEAWKDERKEGRKDGWMDGWMDGWKEVQLGETLDTLQLV
jgi:hypothetical protein